MYWTYENWIHKYARVHRADCAHCNDGAGSHQAIDSRAGQWLGSFANLREALTSSKYEAERCGHCLPTG
jgi:hypothetical protein